MSVFKIYLQFLFLFLALGVATHAQGQYRFGKFNLYSNIGTGKAAYATCLDETCRYDSVVYIGLKYIKGKNGQYWGIVDSTNKMVLPFQYQRVEQLNSYRYVAIKDGSKYQVFDFIDSIYTQTYDYALILYGDRLMVKKNAKFGIIDIKDSVIIPFKFDYIMYHLYNPNVLLTKVANKYSFYNLRLKKQMPCRYDSISGYNIGRTNLMAVYNDGKCGLIDEECNIRIPLLYKALIVHKETYVEVMDFSGNAHIIDFQNRIVSKDDVPESFKYLFTKSETNQYPQRQ